MLYRLRRDIIICILFLGLTRFAIQWPAGTYGIPKSVSGCPIADGFQWMTGSRSQDTNNNTSKNNKSASFHLDGVVDKEKVKRSFCLKTSTAKDQNRNIWPSGKSIEKNVVAPSNYWSVMCLL